MNLAFTTALLLFLLLPGATYRKFYFSEQFSKQFHKSSFIELILAGFLASLILHSVWVCMASLLGYPLDFHVIGMLLMSKDYPKEAFDNISSNLWCIIIYNSSLILTSAVLGLFSNFLIRKSNWKLDRKFKLFRFQNYWHYVFFGEVFDFPRAEIGLANNSVAEIELTFIDVLVEIKDKSLVYQGILVDYELTREGSLDCIYLKGVKRSPLDCLSNHVSERTLHQNSLEIPGHMMVIPYNTVKNVNLTYYGVRQTQTNGGAINFEVFKIR
jgi:hypothetical protein